MSDEREARPPTALEAIAQHVVALDAQARALQASIDVLMTTIGREMASAPAAASVPASRESRDADESLALPKMPATFGGRGQFNARGTDGGQHGGNWHDEHIGDANAGGRDDASGGRDGTLRRIDRDDVARIIGR